MNSRYIVKALLLFAFTWISAVQAGLVAFQQSSNPGDIVPWLILTIFGLAPALSAVYGFIDRTPSTSSGEDALTVALGEDITKDDADA